MDKKNLLSLFDSLPESEKEKIYERNRALMILESVNLKSTLDQMFLEKKVEKEVMDNYETVMNIILKLDSLLLYESLSGILSGIFEAMLADVDEKYNQFYNSENTLLPMKRIIADHTDNISFKNNHIFVNNEDYGEVLELGLKRPNGKIEKNCFYLLSKTKYSFDSRYYGQICKRDIKYKTKLVYEVKE